MKINKIITYSLSINAFIFGAGFFGRLSLNNHEHLQSEKRDQGLQIVLANLKAKTCQRINANVLFSVGDTLPDLEKKSKTILLNDIEPKPEGLISAGCIYSTRTKQYSLVEIESGSQKIIQTYFYDELVKEALAQENQ